MHREKSSVWSDLIWMILWQKKWPSFRNAVICFGNTIPSPWNDSTGVCTYKKMQKGNTVCSRYLLITVCHLLFLVLFSLLKRDRILPFQIFCCFQTDQRKDYLITFVWLFQGPFFKKNQMKLYTGMKWKNMIFFCF